MPHIDQQEDQPDIPLRIQISLDQSRPAFLLGLCHLCIAITGQIHKIYMLQLIKVDGGGFPRHSTDPCQIFSIEDLVNECGLSHIGSARKGDLHPAARRNLGEGTVCRSKFRLVKLHACLLRNAPASDPAASPAPSDCIPWMPPDPPERIPELRTARPTWFPHTQR